MLKIDSLFCGYDGKDVVNNLSFTVKEGERVAVLGPNGCGKTTLLRTLAGIIPYRGAALIDGREVKAYSRLELSKKVALFSQISSVFYAYSVYDVVEMGRYLKRAEKAGIRRAFSGDDDSKTVCKYLKVLGLWDIREKPITELSGGQLQRVMLARAFVQEPDILLLDEPTNHLDISYQLALIELIKDWAAQDSRRILIGVFHDLNLVPSLFDRVILMKDGELLADGDVRSVLKGQELSRAYDADVLGYMQKSGKFWI